MNIIFYHSQLALVFELVANRYSFSLVYKGAKIKWEVKNRLFNLCFIRWNAMKRAVLGLL